VCPTKPSRRLKPAKANYMPAAHASASSDVDSSCCAANTASFPAVHGIATAVEQSSHDVPLDPTVAALKRNLQLDVNWRCHGAELPTKQAPLASPDPLSETSSLASFGSDSFRRQLSGDRRWMCRLAMRMDPIRQSPLCRSSPPSARLVVGSTQTGVVTGLCFPEEDVQDSSSPRSLQDTTACLSQTAAATIRPSSMCQTVVEVHHHQDSPTQTEASKSISDFISEQTDDNVSAELLSDDLPSVQAVCSMISTNGHEVLCEAPVDNCLVADNHCLHAVAEDSSKCKCARMADVSDSEKVDDDGHLPQPSTSSVVECWSGVLPHLDDDVCIVNSEPNRVTGDQL